MFHKYEKKITENIHITISNPDSPDVSDHLRNLSSFFRVLQIKVINNF